MAEKLPPWTEFSAASQDQIFGAGIDLQVTQMQLIFASCWHDSASLHPFSARRVVCK